MQAALLARIADALERLAPPPLGAALPAGDAFVWEPAQGGLIAGAACRRMWTCPCSRAIENQRDTLLANTRALRRGLARQQRAAVGRARHGQKLAGQGGA